MGRAIRILENVQTVLNPLIEEMNAESYEKEFIGVIMDLKDESNPHLFKKAEDIIKQNLGLTVDIQRHSMDDIASDMVKGTNPKKWAETLSELQHLT